jgi:hypothetical protein
MRKPSRSCDQVIMTALTEFRMTSLLLQMVPVLIGLGLVVLVVGAFWTQKAAAPSSEESDPSDSSPLDRSAATRSSADEGE